MPKRRKTFASMLLCMSVSVLLMGCIVEETENGEGDGNGEEKANIVLVDLNGELNENSVDLTFSMKVEGQVDKSIKIGVRASKGSEESWVKEWTLSADSMNRLNEGQTIFEEVSVTLPDWGPGQYTLMIEADRLDEADEEDESDNVQQMVVEVEARPPAAPSGLTRTGTLPCAIAWSDNSDNEDGFNIYLGYSCVNAESVNEWRQVVTVGKDVTSYAWATSCCSVAECSWCLVRAFNDSGESADSNIVLLAPLC